MDLLVNLHSRKLEALRSRLVDMPATIRRALPPEMHIITDWVGTHFSAYWVSEVTIAMAHRPPGCLVATIDGELVGFACHNATTIGFFGPTGVAENQRGKKIGLALLYHTMADMKAQGHAYAIIGAAGPVDFYVEALGAMPIPSDSEDIYQGLLRVNPPTGTTTPK